MNSRKRRNGICIATHINPDELACSTCNAQALNNCDICRRSVCMSCSYKNKYCSVCMQNDVSHDIIKAIHNHEIMMNASWFSNYIKPYLVYNFIGKRNK